MDVSSALRDEGWYLKETAISALKGSKGGYKEIVALALDHDICEIGEKYIQNQISSSNGGVLVGPCVLQISKIRNISAPKDNEYSSVAPRMLKLSLTDGSNTVTAIEYEQLNQISLNTPPGTKVKLVGSVVLSHGSIHLTQSCIKILGGKVDKLYTKWKIAKDMNAVSRMGIQSEGGPPPFITFGKQSASTNRYDKSIKSLQDNAKDKDNENTEFTEQRKAAIAEAEHSSDKVEPVFDAREKFGKRLVEQPTRPRAIQNHDKIQYHPEPQNDKEVKKSVRMYRELPTESGESVHQRTVKDFVSMGFKHEDVVLYLRQTNNDFDKTMDLLTESPGNVATEKTMDDRNNRGRRNASRGGRRNREKSHTDDVNQEQASNPATLMDFIDSRMSNMFIPKKTNEDMVPESLQSHQYDNGRSRYSGHRGRGQGHRRGGYNRDNHTHEPGQRQEHPKNTRYNTPYNSRQPSSKETSHHAASQEKVRQQDSTTRRPGYRNQQKNPLQDFTPSYMREPADRKHNQSNARVDKPTANRYPKNSEKETPHPKVERDQKSSHNHPKQELESNSIFNNIPLNPPPSLGPTTFGGTSTSEKNQANARTNHQPRVPPRFQKKMGQSLHVTIPQWQIGSHCLAKYWEDSQYYRAVITDLHPEAPTAVVQFMDFGNYEEVQMFDLKAIVTNWDEPSTHFHENHHMGSNQYNQDRSNNHTMGNPYNQDRSRNEGGHHQRRQAKPPMALYVPPKYRGNQ